MVHRVPVVLKDVKILLLAAALVGGMIIPSGGEVPVDVCAKSACCVMTQAATPPDCCTVEESEIPSPEIVAPRVERNETPLSPAGISSSIAEATPQRIAIAVPVPGPSPPRDRLALLGTFLI